MARSNSSGFLTKIDKYGQTVGLIYDRKRTYQTDVGGCCTIISFILLLYWGMQLVLGTLVPPGSFKTAEATTLISFAGEN